MPSIYLVESRGVATFFNAEVVQALRLSEPPALVKETWPLKLLTKAKVASLQDGQRITWPTCGAWSDN